MRALVFLLYPPQQVTTPHVSRMVQSVLNFGGKGAEWHDAMEQTKATTEEEVHDSPCAPGVHQSCTVGHR